MSASNPDRAGVCGEYVSGAYRCTRQRFHPGACEAVGKKANDGIAPTHASASAAEIRDELAPQTRALEFSGALPLPTVFGEVFVAPRAVLAVSTGPEGRGVRVHIGGGTAFDISKKDAPRATPRSVALYLARGGALEPADPKAVPNEDDDSCECQFCGARCDEAHEDDCEQVAGPEAKPSPADESRAAAAALLAALEDEHAPAERVRDCAARLLALLPRDAT